MSEDRREEGCRIPHRAYWVEPGKLMAGAYPGHHDPDRARAKWEAMLDCGVGHVLNLMEPDEVDTFGNPFEPYEDPLAELARGRGDEVSYVRISIRDVSVPSEETMVEILDEIDRRLEEEKTVYVHCWGGRGRTGTVVGCWLVRRGRSGEDALKWVRESFARLKDAPGQSPETEEQRAMVRDWAMGR